MRAVIILTCIITTGLDLPAQKEHQAEGKLYEAISKRIEKVEQENMHLSREIRAKDSISYCTLRGEVFNAYAGAPRLSFDFRNTTDKIALTGLFTKLMQANNPSSDILGFRFNDIILAACQKHLIGQMHEEKEKKRFGQVIAKIVSNPVVSSLANTNPITSVVAAIVSTVAGFSTPVLTREKEGGKSRETVVENVDVFQNENITEFREELQVYIGFYDALIIASDNYLTGIANLNNKYNGLMLSVKAYQANLYRLVDGDDSNLLLKLASLLPDPGRQKVDFQSFLIDPKILAASAEARKYLLVQQSVNDFKKEYNYLLLQFLLEYLDALELTKSFPEGTMDIHKVDFLKKEINDFITSQKVDPDDEIDVFTSK